MVRKKKKEPCTCDNHHMLCLRYLSYLPSSEKKNNQSSVELPQSHNHKGLDYKLKKQKKKKKEVKGIREWTKVSQTLGFLPSSAAAPSHLQRQHQAFQSNKIRFRVERKLARKVEPDKQKYQSRKRSPQGNRSCCRHRCNSHVKGEPGKW